uniref:NADH-ubiquinone oxidoreductase chain 4L n=1 Tax=Pedipes pedipes TaxID=999235 RepID=G8HPB3_9EUPU|nr:NADH dehydrogenase subunit 4L [Pedipes pedipes]AEQ93863.1 NADH dehydrogenase subunit 4L [Pedipes pedipes]
MKLVYLTMVMFMFFFFSYMMHTTHILTLLLLLEGMVLSMIGFYLCASLQVSGGSSLFLLLISLAACEAGMGLSLLVKVLRLRGNDKLSSISTMKF